MTAGTENLVRTCSAADAERGVIRNLLPIVGLPGEVWRQRYLIQNFFRRDLLGRFRGSLLGTFWVLVHPIFLFGIYYFVFGVLFRGKTGASASKEYALFLFSGVLVFTAVNEGATRSCTAVVDNGNLVKKVAFPSHLLPIHLILIAMTVYLVGALVCLVAGVAFDVLQPDWKIVLLPVVLVVQFAFTYGLGLLLANCHVFARDTSHLWGIASMTWMFLSPVFWYPGQLRETIGESAEGLFAWNPLFPLLQAHRLVLGARDVVTAEGTAVQFGDVFVHLGTASVWAIVFLAVGYGVFRSRQHKYADLV